MYLIVSWRRRLFCLCFLFICLFV